MILFVIAVGGAVGAVSRYVVGEWVQGLTTDVFPWGTLAVNGLGSFVLGFTMVWLHQATASSELRHFIVIGFLGSFTTFSTFSYEAVALLREGDWYRAGAYAFGSLLLGIVAVLLGGWLATGTAGRS